MTAARKALFEQASIEHARNIIGFIKGADQQTAQPEPPKQRVIWQGGRVVGHGTDRGN